MDYIWTGTTTLDAATSTISFAESCLVHAIGIWPFLTHVGTFLTFITNP